MDTTPDPVDTFLTKVKATIGLPQNGLSVLEINQPDEELEKYLTLLGSGDLIPNEEAESIWKRVTGNDDGTNNGDAENGYDLHLLFKRASTVRLIKAGQFSLTFNPGQVMYSPFHKLFPELESNISITAVILGSYIDGFTLTQQEKTAHFVLAFPCGYYYFSDDEPMIIFEKESDFGKKILKINPDTQNTIFSHFRGHPDVPLINGALMSGGTLVAWNHHFDWAWELGDKIILT